MQIQIFTTGGTIDKDYFDAQSEYEVGHPMVESILPLMLVHCDYTITPLMRKDSLQLTDDDRNIIRQAVLANDAQQVLITHGTDTMVHTGKELKSIPGKTIVLTGALKPARFQESDAVFNLGFALGAVQSLPHGVYICMNGQVFDVDEVHKNRKAGKFEPNS